MKDQNVLGVLTAEETTSLEAEAGTVTASIPDPWTLQTTLASWRKVWNDRSE